MVKRLVWIAKDWKEKWRKASLREAKLAKKKTGNLVNALHVQKLEARITRHDLLGLLVSGVRVHPSDFQSHRNPCIRGINR